MNHHRKPRKRLSDILQNRNAIAQAWAETEAASELKPLSPGEYIVEVIDGEPCQSMSNSTPGYRLTMRVREPVDHAGRLLFHTFWLSPSAIPYTKRDLAKLGITDLAQLDEPPPGTLILKVRITLRSDDAGRQWNEVRTWELIAVEERKPDPFEVDPGADPNGDGEETPF